MELALLWCLCAHGGWCSPHQARRLVLEAEAEARHFPENGLYLAIPHCGLLTSILGCMCVYMYVILSFLLY